VSNQVTAYSGNNKQHSFAQVPKAEHPRSTFNRSSNYKTTFDSGLLIPVYLDQDILPGDTVTMNASMFARMATPLFPLMDQLYLDTFWFFCPNRILWDKWAFFMGEEEVPGDALLAPKYTTPQVLLPSVTTGSMADYFGLPLTSTPQLVSALPFRAYNLIWSEWFRDESLQLRPVIEKGRGTVVAPTTDAGADYPLRARGKRKDYITSALPWPQKGPTVLLPLGATAPVTITGSGTPTFTGGGGGAASTLSRSAGAGIEVTATIAGNAGALNWSATALSGVANLATATSASINELRQSFQVQRLLERDARGGSRLTELVRSHFGVISPDSRLQRPEFLGGSTINVMMNPVPQTSETTGTSVQGNLSAYATATGKGGTFTHSFTEHGVLMCLVAVRAPLNYQQGRERGWVRRTRFEYYWPALQSIGEQAILNAEVFFQNNATDLATFGFQERWAEYRYKQNLITGQMRSDAALSLDAWHLAQDFAALPTLNATFIQDTPPISRVVAVPSEPEFILDAYYSCKHSRVMPVFSVPGMIDHF